MIPPPGRSPIAIGFEWASRITVVAVTFIAPILLGFGLDRYAGSAPVGVLVGMVLGLAIGMVQLIRVASDSAPKSP